jgi:hypothetical protein
MMAAALKTGHLQRLFRRDIGPQRTQPAHKSARTCSLCAEDDQLETERCRMKSQGRPCFGWRSPSCASSSSLPQRAMQGLLTPAALVAHCALPVATGSQQRELKPGKRPKSWKSKDQLTACPKKMEQRLLRDVRQTAQCKRCEWS